MSKTNDTPAFPVPNEKEHYGMSLLDYFAAKAMQSNMINCDAMKVNGGYIAESAYVELAKYSYDIAEAMLIERNKRLEH